MFSTLRTRFGIPGVISVVALVFAMFGGAYAASNSSGGKATISAKAKKGPRGPRGVTGPAGPKGDTGSTGAKGANGKDGVSVTSAPTTVDECPTGGTKFTAANGVGKVCNGKRGEEGEPGPEGSPWTANGTLPSEATETGTFAAGAETGGFFIEDYVLESLSFPIPLEEAISDPSHVEIVTGPAGENCENTEHEGGAGPGNPEADPGYLCIYVSSSEGLSFEEASAPDGNPVGVAGTSLLLAVSSAPAYMQGTWAVTAP